MVDHSKSPAVTPYSTPQCYKLQKKVRILHNKLQRAREEVALWKELYQTVLTYKPSIGATQSESGTMEFDGDVLSDSLTSDAPQLD